MRCCVAIQGRLGSSRLPAKLALDICGAPLLHRVVQRAAQASGVDEIVLATSDLPQDDVTAELGRGAGIRVLRGSLHDARDRFLRAAAWCKADVLIRLTADNPFVEPSFIEQIIQLKRAQPQLPYIAHDLTTVVHGTASELIDVPALRMAAELATGVNEGEHITPHLRYRPDSVTLTPDAAIADPYLSLSVDEIDDYVSVYRLYSEFGGGRSALAQIVSAFRSQAGDPSRFQVRASHRGR